MKLHISDYAFCGPGNKLEKRLARVERPLNNLDEKCSKHDIFYSKGKETESRNQADEILAIEA